MTLFGHIASTDWARLPPPTASVLGHCAEEILRAAAAQGYPRCAFTEEQIGARDRD